MEKLTMLTKVQKLISTLKNTECSQKEKLLLFGQIADCLITPPSIRGNEKYLYQMSSAITILLMFCEEIDSVVRMNAEEHLNRIIRFNEHTNIFRIQFDLYHEIKKNGNEKSLRICLNIFTYYMHMIKQRKIRPFGLNLLPCIYSISRRAESLLLETLSEFMKSFCKYLQICLNENEIRKLIEVFICDSISDCAVKRRYATQNVIYIIENSRRKEIIARYALNTALELLTKEYSINAIIGVLGFLRTFLPIVLQQSNEINNNIDNNYWFNIIIEIYDLCLNLLIDDRLNHSIINASLEVICLILNEPQEKLKHLLTSFDHIEIIRKKQSLTSLLLNGNYFLNTSKRDDGYSRRKSSIDTVKDKHDDGNNSDVVTTYNDTNDDIAFVDETTFSCFSKMVDINETENINECRSSTEVVITPKTTNETKSIENIEKTTSDACSDIEMDSLKSCDIETEITKSYSFTSTLNNVSTVSDIEVNKKKNDSLSLKSQKSTESIGSIFNSLFSNSNTESVTKFFRSPKPSSVPSTPKNTPSSILLEDDNLSIQSIGSRMSSSSHLSTFEKISKSNISTPVNSPVREYKLLPADMDESLNTLSKAEIERSEKSVGKLKNIAIGTTYEQNLIYYTARLVSAKFLLTGDNHELMPDTLVRISIKNISLLVMANCVRICPKILLLPLSGNDPDDFTDIILEPIKDIGISKEMTNNSNGVLNVIDKMPTTTLTEDEIQINIIDDHFGKNSTDYLECVSQLSKSIDTVLTSHTMTKEVSIMGLDEKAGSSKIKKMLSKSVENMCDIASDSEQGLQKKYTEEIKDGCVNLTKCEYSNQIIKDILLYYNNIDPILRGNVIQIIGNFILAVFDRHYVFDNFFQGENRITHSFLCLEKLLRILLKGLSDETHTVVKQALVTIENVLSPLMCQQTINTKNELSFNTTIEMNKNKDNILLVNDRNFGNIKIDVVINELLLVYDNKYWVVQAKYCDLISKLDFENIKLTCGPTQAHQYERRCLDHLFALIGDKDIRIRTAAVSSLCQFIINNNNNRSISACDINSTIYISPSSNQSYRNMILLNRFVSERVFKELPKPLCYIKKSAETTTTTTGNSNKIDKMLGKILYYLTNKLVEVNSKNEQFGVINAIMNLIKYLNPVNFQEIWNEFNLLEVCWSHLNENFTTGIDLTVQFELIDICSNLLAGNIIASQLKSKEMIDNLLHHNLKILNIFHHVFTNLRPIFIPKGSKELNTLNTFGYFGNDYFYMKMHDLIQNSYNNYKTSINNNSAINMMKLLSKCLDCLAVLFEIKAPGEIVDSIKLIEEVLIYLTSSINFEPIKSVICIRHMLKYMFSMSYICRKKQYDYLTNCLVNLNVSSVANKVLEIVDAVREFDSYEPIIGTTSSEPLASSTRSNNVGSPKRMPGIDIRINMGNHIKIFEPIVLRCLILFTKSHAEFQSIILDMLCQTLEFKVDYCLLDANNVFINFIYELLERIETGTVRNCELIIPRIMKFLFYLSKQREKKIITMPKIINITDTLLANNVILSSSTLALNELAFECFFKENLLRTTESKMMTIQDQNTQKEVALSMLIKFMHNIEIQYMISTILLINKSMGDTNNENEVLVNLLQLISDEKMIIKDLNGYESVDILFKSIQTNFMLDELNFKKLLSIWFNMIVSTNNVDLNKMSLITIFMENAILHAPEIYLLTHLESYLNNLDNKSSGINNDDDDDDDDKEEMCEKQATYWMVKNLNQIINDTILFINKNGLEDNVRLVIGLFEKLLKNVSSRVNQFPMIMGLFKQKYVNGEFCAMIFTLKCKNIETVLILIEFLLNIDCEKFYILHEINNNSSSSSSSSSSSCGKDINYDGYDKSVDSMNCVLSDSMVDIKLKREIIRLMCRKYPNIGQWKTDEINILIEDCIVVLLDVGKELLLEIAGCAIYSMKVLKKLKVLLLENNRKEIMEIYLEMLENSDLKKSLKNKKMEKSNMKLEMDCVADSNWFINEVKQLVLNEWIPNKRMALLLSEIKIETQLQTIILAPEFNIGILEECFNLSFSLMMNGFKTECIQYNAHISCLKMNSLLKVSMQALLNAIKNVLAIKMDKSKLFDIFNDDSKVEKEKKIELTFTKLLNRLMVIIKTYMDNINLLEEMCLAYVESELVGKYLKDNLLKPEHYELFIKFVKIAILYGEYLILFSGGNDGMNNEISTDVDICLKCTDSILKQECLWIELNEVEKKEENAKVILNVIDITIMRIMGDTFFLNKYYNNDDDVKIKKNSDDEINNETLEFYIQAIRVGKFIEIVSESNDINCSSYGNPEAYMINNSFFRLKKILLSLSISILRTDELYFFGITPYEILVNYDINLTNRKLNCLPSIPIDYLNDIDVVDKFVKRIHIFGFISRQNFEEFFMSLLVLVNNDNDLNVIDMTEQFQIKNVCLLGILELLISCKSFGPIGRRDRKFIHSPRTSKIKADNICIKKLGKVLLELPGSNIFSQSNLECCQTVVVDNDNGAGKKKISSDNMSTNKFMANQMEMNLIWQIIEDVGEKKLDINLKNERYFITKCGIDLKSSVQLIFDVFSQLIERNYTLLVPHLVKLCEICENREQFRWIKDITLKLRDIIPMENSICHQSIIYCLCKSYAILVPSLSDLSHLCIIIQYYLKSNHLFVRNSTLRGLLCLVESCVKTNSTIGSLNDELLLIRNIVINYITKYGIIEESCLAFSDEHSKLVWTLNFYMIENTSKFIPDCNLLENTIISSNNILKRTIHLDQYLCILHGLERLVSKNVVNKALRVKIEKIALDLVKLENDGFSIPGLILLVTCVYVGSAAQLENTEICNGIIEDEPEVVVEFTEKIEALFNEIKIATPDTALIYGNVLSNITKDLVPPNEILTKAIKELVLLSQPHCEVIGKIVFQVFRSAIDSSYLLLLQDWIICSLGNFLSFPINKAVWSLAVILISASVNINLIKMFPSILFKDSDGNDDDDDDDNDGDGEHLFILNLLAKDFYSKLNAEQKRKFKGIICGSKYEFIKGIGENLIN